MAEPNAGTGTDKGAQSDGAKAIAAAEAAAKAGAGAGSRDADGGKPAGKSDEGQDNVSGAAAEETAARTMGWTPKEDWVKQGKDPEKWRDAKGFIEYGKENSALLRERVEKLSRSVTNLTERAEKGEQAAADLAELKHKAEERGYERAKKEILAQHAKAVKDGDGELAAETLEKLDDLKKPEPPAKPTPKEDPAFAPWKERNTWFDKDKDMRRYADRIARGLAIEYQQTGVKVGAEDFLAEVESEVKARFPDKFRAGGSAPPSPEGGGQSNSGGGTNGGGRKTKSFDDLPQEAKDACNRITSTKYKGKAIMTRDQYVKDYFGDTA